MKDFILQDILFDFEEIDSTNQKAKEIAQNGAGGLCFVVTAKRQTAGKGRMQRKWDSGFEGNIYMTIALHESFAGEMAGIMPLYACFCVIEAIGERAFYKWANDVIVEGKKVCGILVEKTAGFFIVGIGVNVLSSPNQTIFPAGNLKEFGLFTDCESIFKSFQNNIEKRGEFITNTLAKRFFTEGEVSVNQGEFVGIFEGLSPDGSLLLKTRPSGTIKITFGDVGV